MKAGRGSPHGGVFLDIAWIKEKLPNAEEHIKRKLPSMYHQFKELADLVGVNPADIIRELIKSGIFATINQVIDRDTASLSVTFLWPFAGGYHVLAVNQQDYSWAMISGPSRSYLWILSRHPELSTDIKNRLVSQARGLGFPVDDLIVVDHGKPNCAPG